MRTLVLKQNGVLTIEERPKPRRELDTDVLVRVVASGICSSDIHRAFENGAYHYPLVMGHEFSGVVEEPPRSGAFAAGDRVAVFPLIPCRKCPPCRIGQYAQCISYDYLGSRSDGGFAEYVVAPEDNLRIVPDDVSLLHAATTEPCAVALHAVNKLTIKPGMVAAVFGAGPIGLMAAQWLRISGCSRVLVAEIDDSKVELIRSLGFDRVHTADDILGETDGHGVDCAVEAVGLPVTFLGALRAVARGGQVVLMGNIRGDLSIPEGEVSSLLRREVTIRGTWNSSIEPVGHDEWSVVLATMGKGMNVGALISHTPSLEQGAEILGALRERSEPFMKVVFQVTQAD